MRLSDKEDRLTIGGWLLMGFCALVLLSAVIYAICREVAIFRLTFGL